jgi:hypothetical protein
MATPIVANGAPVRNQLLYILRSSAKSLIKVGVSYDPEQRLRQLVTGHPYELEVAYVVEFEENLAESVEKITKAILDHCKTKDQGEWFRISVDGAVEAIKLARATHEFCRKRIPERIVETRVVRDVFIEVPTAVLPKEYADCKAAIDLLLLIASKRTKAMIWETVCLLSIVGCCVFSVMGMKDVYRIWDFLFKEDFWSFATNPYLDEHIFTIAMGLNCTMGIFVFANLMRESLLSRRLLETRKA